MADEKWISNATWSKHPDTQDAHCTKRTAQAVCDIMLTDYTPGYPCKDRGICLNAWVTEVDGRG